MNPNQYDQDATITQDVPLLSVVPFHDKLPTVEELNPSTLYRGMDGDVWLRAVDAVVNLKTGFVITRIMTTTRTFTNFYITEVLGTLKVS